MKNEVLVIDNISKSYDGHQALQNVSIRIPGKCIFGLLGPNGAGKSTLIRIITQIIQADSGNIYINQEALKPEHVNLIGYLPEERGLYKKMRVDEHLLFLAQLKGLSKTDAMANVNEWLHRLEISAWSGKRIESLSKGMQQKIQFIAAVVHNPSIIILDEPFSGFDPLNTALITEEILRLKEKGCTIIFSTHRMETVEELCDYVTLINKSRKVMEGSREQINKLYATNSFIVKHKGDLTHSGSLYQTISKNFLENNHYSSEIKINPDAGINDVLAELMTQAEIVSIIEKVPDMKDIFIRIVNEDVYAKDIINS